MLFVPPVFNMDPGTRYQGSVTQFPPGCIIKIIERYFIHHGCLEKFGCLVPPRKNVRGGGRTTKFTVPGTRYLVLVSGNLPVY